MEENRVKRLAGVLKILVLIAFVCNLLILPLIPGLVIMGFEGGRTLLLAALTGQESENAVALFLGCCWQALPRVWRWAPAGVLTAFLLFCAGNTAYILWQGKRILDTVRAGLPFQRANARSMRRVAASCGLIALAALVRLIWGLFYYVSPAPLFTYNALFVPLFTVGALLCLVISALVGQAAVLREDSDLTI